MDSRSSTFSSEAGWLNRWSGKPVAGLLAALCVVLVDLFAASDGFPWPQLVSQVRPVQSVYWGVTRDRAELRRSRLADAPTARVAIRG